MMLSLVALFTLIDNPFTDWDYQLNEGRSTQVVSVSDMSLIASTVLS